MPSPRSSRRDSIASAYSDQSRRWSSDAPEWATIEDDDFEPVDGSFGHINPYAGKSLSTIIETDTPATSFRYSNSTIMMRHSRGGSSPPSDVFHPRRATPANETLALLEAQKAETGAVKAELEACRLVIRHLEAERERGVAESKRREERVRELGLKVEELDQGGWGGVC